MVVSPEEEKEEEVKDIVHCILAEGLLKLWSVICFGGFVLVQQVVIMA